MGKISSRKFKSGDETEIVKLYNLFTGRSRTVEQHGWEWLDTPEGWGSMWVIEYEETDNRKIVGHHGLIPIKFSYFGRPILAGKTENTMLHPEYRNKIPYVRFEERFVEEAKDRFDLLYTVSGFGAPRRIREHLGYKIVGPYAFYIKILRIRNFNKMVAFYINRKIYNKLVARLLIGNFKLITPFLYLITQFTQFFKKGLIDSTIKLDIVSNIEEVADEIDSFWSQNKRIFGITADKNSRYLKWRIFGNPNVTHSFFLARKNGEMVGYIILKKARSYQVQITDIHVKDNNAKIFNAILDWVSEKFKKEGICLISFKTLLSHNFLNQTLRQNGFMNCLKLLEIVNKAATSVFLVKIINADLESEKLFNRNYWYFTDILSEGI